jgi:hypothetical protein
MKLIKRYIFITVTVLAVILLLILRNTGQNHFRYDAKKHAGPSYDRSNILSTSGLKTLNGDILLLLLGNDITAPDGIPGRSLRLAPDSVMSDKYTEQIGKHKGPVVLYSSDNSVSSRVWMVLAQTGRTDLYICLSDSSSIKK